MQYIPIMEFKFRKSHPVKLGGSPMQPASIHPTSFGVLLPGADYKDGWSLSWLFEMLQELESVQEGVGAQRSKILIQTELQA